MKRHFWLMLLVCSLCPSIFAQKKNPVTTVIKEILPRQAKNLQGAVESMPADKFSFKPTPPQMTFGHLVTHMIDSNYYLCAKASDTPQPKVDMPKETDKEGAGRRAQGLPRFLHDEPGEGRRQQAGRHDSGLWRAGGAARVVADRADERLGRSLFGGGDVSAVERIVAADRAAEEVDFVLFCWATAGRSSFTTGGWTPPLAPNRAVLADLDEPVCSRRSRLLGGAPGIED